MISFSSIHAFLAHVAPKGGDNACTNACPVQWWVPLYFLPFRYCSYRASVTRVTSGTATSIDCHTPGGTARENHFERNERHRLNVKRPTHADTCRDATHASTLGFHETGVRFRSPPHYWSLAVCDLMLTLKHLFKNVWLCSNFSVVINSRE